MSQFDIVMPKLGESITEATITKWFKKENDQVEEDEVLLEIATDKVDSEIPSPVAGKISKIFFKEGDVVPVGQIIATILLVGSTAETNEPIDSTPTTVANTPQEPVSSVQQNVENLSAKKTDRFYSPVIRT